MYEKLSDKMLSRVNFFKRIAKHVMCIIFIMISSVFLGAAGFIIFEDLLFEDAIMHSTFILSGFGLIAMPTSTAGKMFAGFFGLYANIFFLASFSILFAPITHRILHRLHVDDES